MKITNAFPVGVSLLAIAECQVLRESLTLRHREQAHSYKGERYDRLLGRLDCRAEFLRGIGRVGFRVVDVVGDYVKERALYGQRGRHVVRHAWLQAAAFGICQEVFGRSLGARVE